MLHLLDKGITINLLQRVCRYFQNAKRLSMKMIKTKLEFDDDDFEKRTYFICTKRQFYILYCKIDRKITTAPDRACLK